MFEFEKKALDEFLKGLKFPLDKEKIIQKSTDADLPHQVQLLLQRLDERKYGSAQEVEQGLAAHKA